MAPAYDKNKRTAPASANTRTDIPHGRGRDAGKELSAKRFMSSGVASLVVSQMQQESWWT